MSKSLMDRDLKWKLTYGALSLILGALATRLALYLTNKIWGSYLVHIPKRPALRY